MPAEVEIIKINTLPPELPRVIATKAMYVTWVNSLEDLKKLAKHYNNPILLKEILLHLGKRKLGDRGLLGLKLFILKLN